MIRFSPWSSVFIRGERRGLALAAAVVGPGTPFFVGFVDRAPGRGRSGEAEALKQVSSVVFRVRPW